MFAIRITQFCYKANEKATIFWAWKKAGKRIVYTWQSLANLPCTKRQKSSPLRSNFRNFLLSPRTENKPFLLRASPLRKTMEKTGLMALITHTNFWGPCWLKKFCSHLEIFSNRSNEIFLIFFAQNNWCWSVRNRKLKKAERKIGFKAWKLPEMHPIYDLLASTYLRDISEPEITLIQGSNLGPFNPWGKEAKSCNMAQKARQEFPERTLCFRGTK